jgi:hypothetical protein
VHDAAAAPADLLNLHELVAKARQNLNQNDWDYIVGGVESETTLRRNRMALDAIAFRPRVLRDVSKVDASVSSMCAATKRGSTITSSAPSPTAMPRSASQSTPRITAGANATSPSAS